MGNRMMKVCNRRAKIMVNVCELSVETVLGRLTRLGPHSISDPWERLNETLFLDWIAELGPQPADQPTNEIRTPGLGVTPYPFNQILGGDYMASVGDQGI